MADFGLYLPQINLDFSELLEAVVVAESLGFRHVWFIDHFQVPGYASVMDGWTVATAVAARTSTIRVGHLVLCASHRPPALLGKMAVTLDRISEGRLDLGLGWGSSPGELQTYIGNTESAAVRQAKLAETIQIVRQMLKGGHVQFRGAYNNLEIELSAPAAAQDRVPIFVGGAGAATTQLARRLADWWNCPSYAQQALGQLAPLSRPARISVNYSIALCNGSARAPQRGGSNDAPVFTGDPAALAEILAADQALGTELFNIQFVHPGSLINDMESFMERVAPALR